MSRPPKYYFNTCEICGAAFEARKAGVKTCSADCKRKLQAKRMLEKYGRVGSPYRLELRQCTVCGRTYEPVVGNQKSCSAMCNRILQKRRRDARKTVAQPEPIQTLPLHLAEDICRKLGMTYGAASAEAFNCGLTLSQFLVVRARAEGIQIKKEECL